ncbi:MAG: hypothetical protein QOJ29_798 [Thermoleophilaceae bacterium]|nr:hypothetical protein [Thermoleophilaceae bacterium]
MSAVRRLSLAHGAAAVLCVGVALMHQPRPAAAAFASFLALSLTAGRRWALALSAVVGLGLIAAAPIHPPRHVQEDVHGRAPAHRHSRPRS